MSQWIDPSTVTVLVQDVSGIYNALMGNRHHDHHHHQKEEPNIKMLLQKQMDLTRLESVKLKNESTTQNRVIELNESKQKRMAQINKIVLIAVVTLAIICVLLFVFSVFPIIPVFVQNIILILIFVAGTIYAGENYLVLIKRDPMNYDQLLLPPNIPNVGKIVPTVSPPPVVANSPVSGCFQQSCCGNGSIWDVGNLVCKGNTICDGFGVMPSEAFEFSNYSLLKK